MNENIQIDMIQLNYLIIILSYVMSPPFHSIYVDTKKDV